jgi:hypothetical protein
VCTRNCGKPKSSLYSFELSLAVALERLTGRGLVAALPRVVDPALQNAAVDAEAGRYPEQRPPGLGYEPNRFTLERR